ncbi:MAG: radical SAM family heme chaperone HemW [Candidatus Rokubacteria bacterium]|nr:radical SAM family heme chaperone HemW [Candidatus Rokubacteria bacterium]
MLADTAPRDVALGLYVHVPFCAKRCAYCAFNTAPLEEGAMARYLGALRREIDLLAEAPWAGDVVLATIFLGGGTPSLLPPDDLAALLAAVRTAFRVAADAEVTVECNPESVTRPRLEAYRAAGVARLSRGDQSLDDAMLRRLGRLPGRAEARGAFGAAREAGFGNVSVDVMYGLPGLEPAAWTRTITTVLDWEPEHLSAYGLTLDPGSLWGARGVEGLPSEEAQVDQYWTLARMAAARGYEHYEISNYARPGFRSRHNQTYWRAGEYLACGPGGCGFVGDVRYGNAKPLARYCADLESGRLPIEVFERLTARERLAERLILGLRTADGVPTAWLAERVAGDAALRRRIGPWEDAGLLVEANGRVRLSEAGFLLSDALFVELL